ncbi:MAG TPA: hypothetical protein VGR73_09575 [Bryobacteraceae bacterium]|nr:hypothetical protein [Bryobacteraceae bacterium]
MNKASIALEVLVLVGAVAARGATFSDSLTAGINPMNWTVTQTTPGIYSVVANSSGVNFATGSGTNPGGLQDVQLGLNMSRIGGPVSGDFSMQVDFANAQIPGPGTDQVEFHAVFQDGTIWVISRDSTTGGGQNVHIWNGSQTVGITPTPVTEGTMTITRNGSTLSAFLNGNLFYSASASTTPLTQISMSLQNNLGSGDATSVTFRNFSINAAGTPAASQAYYFSDLAFGGGLQTTLTYVNYSPQAVTCATNFYSDPGASLPIPFSQGTVSTRTDTLQPGQSIHDQSVANLTAPVTEGWAQASCTGPVQASVLYRLYQSGVPVGEASVNAETAATTEFVTFAQTATGVAYANPSPTQSAMITFTVYNATGAKLGSHVTTLGPLAHGSANLGPLLGLQSFTGFVKITSTIPIISLSLNAEAFPVFSSLPPGDLPSSTTLVP